MNIHIVKTPGTWILAKLAERMITAGLENKLEMSYGLDVNQNADVNYYVDLQNTYFGQKTKCDIAYFTHSDMNSEDWFKNLLTERKAWDLDGMIFMNYRYEKMAKEIGYKGKTTTIVPGQVVDMFPLKKIKIGIVSKGAFPGYGQNFLEDLFQTYDLKNFRFYFLGNGWREGIEPIAKQKEIECKFFPDTDYSIYPNFYNTIDYLLIPSLWTAGPMCFQEALASGVPVISSKVGFCGYELVADYEYEAGNKQQLFNIFNILLDRLLIRRSQVEDLNWNNYMKQLVNFIEEVKNEKTN